jgi:hypothetical protein
MPGFPTPYRVRVYGYIGTVIDAHGNVTDEWDDIAHEVAVHGWAPPSSDREMVGGRTAITRGLDLYAPPETPIGPQDHVEVGGVRYEVVGYPEDYTHGPFAWQAGLRINLQTVEG